MTAEGACVSSDRQPQSMVLSLITSPVCSSPLPAFTMPVMRLRVIRTLSARTVTPVLRAFGQSARGRDGGFPADGVVADGRADALGEAATEALGAAGEDNEGAGTLAADVSTAPAAE